MGHDGVGIDEDRVNGHCMSLVNGIGVTGDHRSARAELPKMCVAIDRSKAPAAVRCGRTASRSEGTVVLVADLASGVPELGRHVEAPVKPLVAVLSNAKVHVHATAMTSPVSGIATEGPGERFVSPVSGAGHMSDAHNYMRKISGNATFRHEVEADFARRRRRGTRKRTAMMGLESMKTGVRWPCMSLENGIGVTGDRPSAHANFPRTLVAVHGILATEGDRLRQNWSRGREIGGARGGVGHGLFAHDDGRVEPAHACTWGNSRARAVDTGVAALRRTMRRRNSGGDRRAYFIVFRKGEYGAASVG